MSAAVLTGQDMVVLAALTGAANAGLACPSNDDLVAMMNAASPASAIAVMKKLERRGLITVERFTSARRVTIVETGRRTAAVAGRPRTKAVNANHRAGMAAFSARKQAERLKAEEENRLAALADASVQREPCFRCGTRGDIGCRHRPAVDHDVQRATLPARLKTGAPTAGTTAPAAAMSPCPAAGALLDHHHEVSNAR